jgi:cation diffusion facilitator family transporter
MLIQPIRLRQQTPSSKTVLIAANPVNRVLGQVLGFNLLVAAAKIAVGVMTGSISMIADGFHSTMDGFSNIIGLVGSTVANQPPDENHPYGHQKYETFATLSIGLLLLVTSWKVLQSIFTRLTDNTTPEVTTLSFAVMLITLVINLGVAWYEKKQGQALNSNLLLADAAHTRSDIFVSLSVLASLLAVQWGWGWLDLVVALLIVLAIGRTGWRIVRQASETLADRVAVDASLVEKIALSVEGVQSCHKIRSRGSEPAIHLDLHIQVDGRMTLAEAHGLGHCTQDRLQKALGVSDVIVHVEPVETL